VLLTREDDRNVAPDGRAAIANNNRADLFISLHANGAFRSTTTGAAIFYVGFDREAEQEAHASLGAERLPSFGGGSRDIDLVVWDLAQIRHIARSSEFARILEGRFRDRIPLSSHAIERAPLRVLQSASMPAVLIEMGYLTNEDQEKQMTSGSFQGAFVQAVYDGIVAFRETLSGGTQ
jgi:N-acetylmuramoyl-L-alanine amidase